jgi:hypothetical protein
MPAVKDEFDDSDDSWYCNAPLGEKILDTFMTNLSKKYKLSEVYTNQSIRATGAKIVSFDFERCLVYFSIPRRQKYNFISNWTLF